ncbi:unnamed protein product [Notodromas monacha]|uniref:Uncharacterized protein n=1 Tax=Notodromas monacha TaxID=399045 RepID=A0A7R9GGT1_9CRUS|nr:unnamed protein product [Notodromas monacha]CAG0920187.1 unnamed protein product [Notodromas monacha]
MGLMQYNNRNHREFYVHPETVSSSDGARPAQVIKPDQPRTGMVVRVNSGGGANSGVAGDPVTTRLANGGDQNLAAICSLAPIISEVVQEPQTTTPPITTESSSASTTTTSRTTTITTTTATTAKATAPKSTVAQEMTTDEVKTKKPPLLKTRFCRGTDLSEIEDSYEFPRAREGEVAERNCPLGWAGVARWRCGEGGEWASKYPDFSDCASPLNIEDALMKLNSSEMTNPAEILYRVAKEAYESPVSGSELPKIGAFLEQAADEQAEYIAELPQELAKESALQFLTRVSNLTTSILRKPIIWETIPAKSKKSAATKVQNGVEKAALQLASKLEEGDSRKISTEGISIRTLKEAFNPSSVKDIVFKYNDSELTIPAEWINSMMDPRKKSLEVAFFGYNDLHKVLESYKNMEGEEYFENGDDEMQSVDGSGVGKVDGLNSQIIGASVNFGKRRIARMAQDLANSGYNAETSVDGPRIKFRNLRTVDVNDGNGSVMCSYWHIGRDEWATDGCRMVLLTPSETMKKAMTWITISGCILSIICMLLTATIFTFVKSIGGETASIHRNLCLCLSFAEIVLLAGLDATSSKLGCSFVAALLHYLFLVAFGWMLVEGVQIYLMVTQVFQSKKSNKIWFVICAFGIPALIVGITAAATKGSVYGTRHQYENFTFLRERNMPRKFYFLQNKYENFFFNSCWFEPGSAAFLSFVVPLAVVITVNAFILIVALRKATHRNQKKPLDTRDEIRVWAKGATSLSFLLGLTWIFGFFMVGHGSSISAIIFTVLNSTQGIFIFLFYVVMNKRTRRETLKKIDRTFPIFHPLLAQFVPELSTSGGTKKGTSSGTRTTSASGEHSVSKVCRENTHRSTLKWLKWKYTLHITKSTDSAAPFSFDTEDNVQSSPERSPAIPENDGSDTQRQMNPMAKHNHNDSD